MKFKEKIIERVRDTVIRNQMIDPGDRIVVAVSGGPDSVCLLDIFSKLREEFHIELIVAHLNHGLRGKDSDQDERFVKNLSRKMGIVCHTKKIELYRIRNKRSIEEAARDERYTFLFDVLRDTNAKKIATAHHMDDQAETFFINLLRGSGPKGLSGIPERSDDGKIIRPLLGLRRYEILKYLKDLNLLYRVDESNFDKRYLRNAIRHELMPMLLKIQPQIIEHIHTLSKILKEEDRFLDELISSKMSFSSHEKDKKITVSINEILTLPEALKARAIRILIGRISTLKRLTHIHIENIVRMLHSPNPQKEIHLPDGMVAKKRYNELILEKKKAEHSPPSFIYHIPEDGIYHIKEASCMLKFEVSKIDPPLKLKDEDKYTAFISEDKARYPLIVRNFRKGDKFRPLGLEGTKKIKDLFIDLKIPKEQRYLIPLVIHKNKIIWVCGIRISEEFKITDNTEKILKITFSKT